MSRQVDATRVLVAAGVVHPDRAAFDVAERKGIGHPDSLADLVADAFSHRYATVCLRRFGLVPNHWVDKVTLVGAAADVRFGGFDIRKPVDAYLFGKLTGRIGEVDVPIADLFAEVVHQVLPEALGDITVLEHLRLTVNNTAGTAVDHDAGFYQPTTTAVARQVLAAESVANDTVLCAGSGAPGVAARVAVWLEQTVTAPGFRRRYPIGTDVKAMVVRTGEDLDVTMAVPFHPDQVTDWQDYRDLVAAIHDELTGELKRFLDATARPVGQVRLRLNTKDVAGRGYLAPFGTSLGKGDCGAVGRGNRYSGVIEPLRPAGGEAPAGKNPLHHVGKIYTAVADDAARRLWDELGVYAEVVIAARNGDPLDAPAHVLVRTDTPDRAGVADLVREVLATSAGYHQRFLGTDPLARLRGAAW